VLNRVFLGPFNFISVLSLGRIMQTFVTQQWKCQSKDKLINPHGKKQTEKKVKSPLHIFSTLRRWEKSHSATPILDKTWVYYPSLMR